ncbi:hypothetical protein [Bosea sp. PAMC 26642]|uniref:hypothetical protein n=1 Tax=Bosea sp. (strain PAMC 26642) TaxID=1792307 RepID=UPI0012E7F154|nr:hypothetical protein [Bosea sp. PAMC 26642]
MEFYAAKAGGQSFMSAILEANPDFDEKLAHRSQRLYWNAFKHPTRYEKNALTERDDESTLAEFGEERNIESLMMGWTDYGTAVGKMPVEAQVFQVWAFARKPPASAVARRRDQCCRLFPDLDKAPLVEQKRRLIAKFTWARDQFEVMGSPKTELRPLLLHWPPSPETNHR